MFSVDEFCVKVYNSTMTKQEIELMLASARLVLTDEKVLDTVDDAVKEIEKALDCENGI